VGQVAFKSEVRNAKTFKSENMKGRGNLGDLGTDGRIIKVKLSWCFN
jgi:hypothetical protein